MVDAPIGNVGRLVFRHNVGARGNSGSIQLWLAEWRQRQRDIDADKAIARQIGMKVLRVLNETHDFVRHFKGCQQFGPTSDGREKLNWRNCQPLIGLKDDPALNLEHREIDLLLRAGDGEFLSELMLAIGRYQSIVLSMREYQNKYELLYTMVPTPASFDEGLATFRLDKEQHLRLLPHSHMLDALIGSIHDMAAENAEKVHRLTERYTSLMQSHFKVEKWMRIGSPTT